MFDLQTLVETVLLVAEIISDKFIFRAIRLLYDYTLERKKGFQIPICTSRYIRLSKISGLCFQNSIIPIGADLVSMSLSGW